MAKKMNMEDFKNLIKEEALKLNQKTLLENEKMALENELNSLVNESYMEECGDDTMMESELEEILGIGGGKFSKAKQDFSGRYQQQLNALNQAYKAMDMSYVQLSQQLKQAVVKEYQALAQKYGIQGQSDMGVFHKDLMKLVEPMDVATFQRQVQQGGASIGDVAAGASAGRSKIVGTNESLELTMSEFREIIKEEAIKLKNRIVLENEKKALMSELKSLMNESYMEEELNEVSPDEAAHAEATNFLATHPQAEQVKSLYQTYKGGDKAAGQKLIPWILSYAQKNLGKDRDGASDFLKDLTRVMDDDISRRVNSSTGASGGLGV